MDTRSQLNTLKQCRELLDKGAPVLFFPVDTSSIDGGAPVLFFPEGTRSVDRVMADFKKGAFSIVVKSGCDVVPITITGTGKIMPSGKESQMYSGKVKIVVHPTIKPQGKTADQCS
eukprot:gene29540-5888_t